MYDVTVAFKDIIQCFMLALSLEYIVIAPNFYIVSYRFNKCCGLLQDGDLVQISHGIFYTSFIVSSLFASSIVRNNLGNY